MKLLTAAAAITTCLLMSGNVMAQNIQIKVDGKAYAGGLNGNDAAKDFAAKLPLKLKFEDFGSTERISYLPKSLNLGSAPRSCDPQKGDITYYIPWGNLAVFVRDFRPSDNLVPLGKLSPEALKAIQESGQNPVCKSARYSSRTRQGVEAGRLDPQAQPTASRLGELPSVCLRKRHILSD